MVSFKKGLTSSIGVQGFRSDSVLVKPINGNPKTGNVNAPFRTELLLLGDASNRPTEISSIFYSSRKAAIGSTLMARRAGT